MTKERSRLDPPWGKTCGNCASLDLATMRCWEYEVPLEHLADRERDGRRMTRVVQKCDQCLLQWPDDLGRKEVPK